MQSTDTIHEIISKLAFFADSDYNFVRFVGCTYREREDKIIIFFIYDLSVEKALDALKPKLETEIKEYVKRNTGDNYKFAFEYEKRYIDAVLLALAVEKFLAESFPVLSIGRDAVDVNEDRGTLDVNIKLQKQNIGFVRNSKRYRDFVAGLGKDYFCVFNFHLNEIVGDLSGEVDLDALTFQAQEEVKMRVDKTMKISGMEYWLGKPIKERPIRIEFLRKSTDDQVIAGTIQNLTKREYTPKKKDGVIAEKLSEETHGAVEEKKPYYTFILNDGKDTVSCTFFPRSKTKANFEKLVDGTVVAVIGVHNEYKGRYSMVVGGISWCEVG